MALLSSGENCHVASDDCTGTHATAALALSALNNLNRAVAVIGPDGRTLFSNPPFGALFGGEGEAEELRAALGPAADWTDRAGPREITLLSGRVCSVETVRLQQGLLVTAEDVSEQVAERARTAALAQIDALTRLGNHAMFSKRLAELLDDLDPAKDAAAVLTIKLHRFKAINDALGTPIGDALLRAVADRLRSAVGRRDIVARLGGDLFGTIQIGVPQPQSAATLAKRLVDLLGRAYLVEGHVLTIGASVGIALVPADGMGCEQILKNADQALCRARQDAGGGYRFFEAGMNEQMQARRSLEIDLRRAQAMRELALVYQPQFNLEAQTITGFEALLRWHSPIRGFVPPGDFIPLAEEIGLIVPIGAWVVHTACREAAGWPSPLKVAVNVSAVQFGNLGLVATIQSALAESGLDPGRLELEITESVLIGDQKAAFDVLHQIRRMGVRVAVDDFGTGYSSLSYLRSFPFDKIKIDQSFVRNDSDDRSGMAIVRAIAALGRSLGMTTIAEGVETTEQLARVAASGCTDVQGYLIGKPLPPEQVGSFLQSRSEVAAAAAIARSHVS